jgi:hypothetical protein
VEVYVSNPFDYVKDIQRGKKDIIRNSENPSRMEAGYNPFMVNRALSFYPDSILYANEMNRRGGLDGLLQFDYLINTVRSMKRDHQWIKKSGSDSDAEMLAEYFGMSPQKVHEALRVLTRDQLDDIRKRTIKGGT